MDVSDRRMQVQLTQEARIASDFLYIRAILAVVGFVSALRRAHRFEVGAPFCHRKRESAASCALGDSQGVKSGPVP